MMLLEKMVKIMEKSFIAESILQKWEYDENSMMFWRASSNFVYKFKHQGNTYFLRFSNEEDNSQENIAAELDILQYLNTKNYPCVTPVKSKNGKYVEAVNTSEGTFYAVVFNEAKGAELDINEMSAVQFEEWGKSLGLMHRLLAEYRPKQAVRMTWRDSLDNAN